VTTAYERALDLFRERGSKTINDARGVVVKVQCPAHDDNTPSLRLSDGGGSVLMHCFAGCTKEDVLAALGWSKSDLFDTARTVYEYPDRTVIRSYTSDGKKDFRQRGHSEGEPTRLYHLDQLAAAGTVYLVEGEKDVHALESVGLTATTAPMGAGNFNKCDVSPLYGKTVVAIVDADQTGDKWAAQVRAALEGHCTLSFRQAAEGKDAADHIAAGLGIGQFRPYGQADDLFARLVADEARKIRVREAARALVAEETRPPAEPFDAGTLAEILARPDDPPARIEGLLPWDAAMLLVAQRKTGKTTLVANMARSLLTGEPFLDRCHVRPLDGDIAFLNYEVSGGQLARWARDVGVPEDRLYLVNLRGRRNPLSNPEDRALLAATLRARGVETVICDPFGRAFTGASQNDAGEVQSFLVSLDLFARGEVGARDVILTAHAGWNGERSRGSSALEDWADSVVTMTRDPEDEHGARYLSAIGRDVDVEEDQLHYDPETRRLSLTGAGSRKRASAGRKIDDLVPIVVRFVKASPGIGVNQLRDQMKAQRDSIAVAFQIADVNIAVRTAVDAGLISEQGGGPGKKTELYATESKPSPTESKTHLNDTESNRVQTESGTHPVTESTESLYGLGLGYPPDLPPDDVGPGLALVKSARPNRIRSGLGG
jgi:5S rRNA maturation endonuclease (ribonuclease M5)